MMDVRQIRELIKETDYTLIKEFLLPASSWVNNYYYPLSLNVARLRIKYQHEPDKLEVIESVQHEIDIFDKYYESHHTILLEQHIIELDEITVRPVSFKVRNLGNRTRSRSIKAGFKENQLGYEMGVIMKVERPVFIF